MSDQPDNEYWQKFFRDAGISVEDATSYASIFVRHRIQPKMLGEINDSRLEKMGITVMGDVISIVKHACVIGKQREESQREAVGTSKDVPVKKPRLSSTASGIKNSFQTILDQSWFVDKTMLIAAVVKLLLPSTPSMELEQRDPLMITAPRRFGKTTNLEMLFCFFGGLVTEERFKELKIGNNPAMQWWGQFSTIYVTFGHFTGDISSVEDCWKACGYILHKAFTNFRHIVDDLSEGDVSAFRAWLDEELYLHKMKVEIGGGLAFLVHCVRQYDKQKNVFLLVDEFDRICSSAYLNTDSNELEKIIRVYCDVVGEAVKHESQCIAVLSGVSAVFCKGLSASLNNLDWRRFLENEEFSKFYGITEDEFTDVMKRPKISQKVRDLTIQALHWYNGYEAFSYKILNTFSVTKFIQKEEVGPYWKESSSMEALDKSTVQEKVIRDAILLLLNDQPMFMNFKSVLKASDFSLLRNKAHKLVDPDLIMNHLLQQGYITIIGDRKSNPVQIKIPNREVKLEFEQLMIEYYVEVCRFDQEKIKRCRDYFMMMDMSQEASCQQNLQAVKNTMNELLSTVKISEINEAWFESFMFQVFFQNFEVAEQEKVVGTCRRKDRRFQKILDLCASTDDRCFLFEFTKECSAENALQKLLKKKYYKKALELKLPFLLIGMDVGKVEGTPNIDLSINYLFNKTSGNGTKI